MPRRAVRWVVGCVALVVTASGCEEREPAPVGELAGDAAAQHTSDATAPAEKADSTTLAEAPPSLRAAAIVAMQRGAGPEYDLALVRDGSGERAYEGELVAMGRMLRVDAAGAAIARAYDGEAELGLRLERAGCAGETARADEAEPEVAQNRASYQHVLGGGRGIDEWYVAGPLGLEQGYTIDESWGCAGELELDVAVRGARVEAGRREGELRLVSAASGERYVYGELAAWDAEGKALTARMERREGGVRLVVNAAGAAYPVVVDPLVWAGQAKLVAGDAAAEDHFGWSVAISGDTALVGAPKDDHAGVTNAGSAYVFVRSDTVWTEQAKLVASDAAEFAEFGWSVAVAGDTAVVGAHYDSNAGGAFAGSAYVFVRSAGAWTEQAKLVASDTAADDEFGTSVALSGETVLVGSVFDDHGGVANRGSAYVFERSGALWTQQAKLVASGAAQDDWFGWAVDLDGDSALVGAFGADHGGWLDPGCVYVFVRAGGTWVEEAILRANDAADSDLFGFSVALSGDTALVGSYADDHAGGTDAGSAHFFERVDGVWTETSKLVASDPASDDRFGISVALAGDTAVVRSMLDDVDGARDTVRAYVFVRRGGAWAEEAKLLASRTAAFEYFGYSLALSGNTAMAGWYLDDQGAIAAGTAYVFTFETSLELGQACSTDTECSSGFCAAGVCCDSACANGECANGRCVEPESGSDGGATANHDEEGCSCRVAGAPSDRGASAPAWIALAGLVMAARLRRRAALRHCTQRGRLRSSTRSEPGPATRTRAD